MFTTLRSLFGSAAASKDSSKEVEEQVRREELRKEIEEDLRKEIEEDLRKKMEEDMNRKVQEQVLAVLDRERKRKVEESDVEEDSGDEDDASEDESEIEDGDVDDAEVPQTTATTTTTTTTQPHTTLKRKKADTDTESSNEGEDVWKSDAKQGSKQQRKRARENEELERLRAENERFRMQQARKDSKKKNGKKQHPTKKASGVPSPSFSFTGDGNSSIDAISNTGSDSLNKTNKTTTKSKNVKLNVAPTQKTVTEAPKKKVMISFHVSSMDKYIPQLVNAIHCKNTDEKFDIFTCTSTIPHGSWYRADIIRAARTCDIYIPLINEEWLKSKECQAETLIAVSRMTHEKGGLVVLPVFIEKVDKATLEALEKEPATEDQGQMYSLILACVNSHFVPDLKQWSGETAWIASSVGQAIAHRKAMNKKA